MHDKITEFRKFCIAGICAFKVYSEEAHCLVSRVSRIASRASQHRTVPVGRLFCGCSGLHPSSACR